MAHSNSAGANGLEKASSITRKAAIKSARAARPRRLSRVGTIATITYLRHIRYPRDHGIYKPILCLGTYVASCFVPDIWFFAVIDSPKQIVL